MKNKPLKNKRGAIMASAVMFMTLLTFMGVLLTSIILYSQTIVRANDKIFQTRLKLDQIGEYFVAGQEIPADLVSDYEDVNADENILALKRKDGTAVVLYIEKDGKIAKVWRYSDK